jgi:hypothetical protein
MREQNIELATLIFPSKMDVLAKRSPEGQYFEGLAREFQVPHLSLMPVLDANRAEMPFYMYDGHLNEFGNRIVAEAVWNWLFTTHPRPLSALGSVAPATRMAASPDRTQ